MHTLMAALGAELLVVNGHLDARTHDALGDALPSAPVDLVRLRADKATIEAHVRGRARGSPPTTPPTAPRSLCSPP